MRHSDFFGLSRRKFSSSELRNIAEIVAKAMATKVMDDKEGK